METINQGKAKSFYDANFVITGGIKGCHGDNLWCHQWWLSWHGDDAQFSVMWYIKDWMQDW